MSGPIIAMLVGLAIIVMMVGGELLRDFAASRERLTLDQRRRADAERARLAGIEERNFWVDAVATSFDPLGFFH